MTPPDHVGDDPVPHAGGGSQGLSTARLAGLLNGTYDPIAKPAIGTPGGRWGFWGDSITAGTGATFGQHWVHILPQIVGQTRMLQLPGVNNTAAALPPTIYNSVNLGTAGQTSAQMLARIDSDLATNGRVQSATLLAGTNDVAQGVPIATWQANIKAFALRCRQLGIPLIIGTIPPFSSAAPSYQARNKQIAAMNLWLQLWAPRAGVPLAQVYNALVDPATGAMLAAYDSDGTHPNAQGHYQIATAFAAAVTATIPSTVATLTNAGFGAVSNPLMTGTVGSTLPTGWAELSGGTGTAPTYQTTAKSGTLLAGQWAQMTFDATASGGARTVGITSSFTLTPGGLALLTGQIEVDDVSGYLASNLAGNSFVALSLQNGGNTTQYATSGSMKGTSFGPIRVLFTVPTGVTAVVVRATALLATGVSIRFRFGGIDVIDLSSLASIDLTV